jgi:hypothetical protein
MRQYVESFVHVRDLQPGDVIDLRPEVAEQFLNNGMAEAVEDRAGGRRLEAATLAPARPR